MTVRHDAAVDVPGAVPRCTVAVAGPLEGRRDEREQPLVERAARSLGVDARRGQQLGDP